MQVVLKMFYKYFHSLVSVVNEIKHDKSNEEGKKITKMNYNSVEDQKSFTWTLALMNQQVLSHAL